MILEKAVEVLKKEADGILKLTEKISPSFEELVNDICASRGRVVISGIGKSGLIGKKIVATLISTGTDALFLHPVEAVHGDLGMVSGNDVFIGISNSGKTNEMNRLLPVIRDIGCRLACFTGNPESTMAKLCDIVIDTGVEKEACPFNMAPTSSTTAQLAMGDALAVVLIEKKSFKKDDFIKSHPGGALGRRLSFRAGEIMLQKSDTPYIPCGSPMDLAIEKMDRFKLGAVIVLDNDQKIKGIITDGDIRHSIATHNYNFKNTPVDDIMTTPPHCLAAESFLYDALNIMEKRQITVLPVIDGNNRLEGLIHLHDILGKGSFKFKREVK